MSSRFTFIIAVTLATVLHSTLGAQEFKKGDFVVLSSERTVEGPNKKSVTFPQLTMMIIHNIEGSESRVSAFKPFFAINLPITDNLPDGKYKMVLDDVLTLDEHIVNLAQKRFLTPDNGEIISRLLIAYYAKELSISEDLAEEVQEEISASYKAEQLALLSLLIERDPTDFYLLASRAHFRRSASNDVLTDRIAKLDFERAISLATTLAAKSPPALANSTNNWIQAAKKSQASIEASKPVVDSK